MFRWGAYKCIIPSSLYPAPKTSKEMMAPSCTTHSLLSLLYVLASVSVLGFAYPLEDFLHCLSVHARNSSISRLVYTPHNSSYLSVLRVSEQNLRFTVPGTPQPRVIVTPQQVSHIQATIYCSKRHDFQVRIRSGGHDYEGLSYVSDVPFVILDLLNLRSISVNLEDNTAWVEAGATIGELYYTIAQKSRILAFPAGAFPSIGVGGHISGGGYSFLSRRYGLSVDQVTDARIIGVDGRVLDRKSMGEDLFWAIRGGGFVGFGVVLAWKINLVEVPENVTVFTVPRTLEQNATKLVHRWQYIADKLEGNLNLRITISAVNSTSRRGGKTVQAAFIAMFLGGVEQLVPLMQREFPELGLVREDCMEINWIQSIPYFVGRPLAPLEELLNRTQPLVTYFKGKSDFVKEPISERGLDRLWERLMSDIELGIFQMLLSPYGGRLAEISESATAFPHRAGILYNIHYVANWREAANTPRYMRWVRRLYSFMAPYVSKSPRTAYINYRDLDLGVNNKGHTSYAQASIWGRKYFNNNFDRLVRVKTTVDPSNFFRSEQSIPPLSFH